MTSTPLIPRAQVHEWILDIERNKSGHKNAINLLLTRQRNLSRYVHKSAGEIQLGSRRAVLFIQGALLRVFDLAGGKVSKITTENISDAQTRVGEVIPTLLPVDDSFVERMRSVEWRAQPHILDECVVSLFDDPDLDREQMVRLFLLAWIVVEAANDSWSPPEDFEGETAYTLQPIDNLT